jgi:hypothetical protein
VLFESRCSFVAFARLDKEKASEFCSGVPLVPRLAKVRWSRARIPFFSLASQRFQAMMLFARRELPTQVESSSRNPVI